MYFGGKICLAVILFLAVPIARTLICYESDGDQVRISLVESKCFASFRNHF